MAPLTNFNGNYTKENCKSQEVLQTFSQILQRIAKIEGEKATQGNMASALKISQQSLSGYITRDKIPYKELIEYANRKEISLDWLMKGKGEPQKEEISEEESSAEIKKIIEALKILPRKSVKKIYLITEMERLDNEH
ncbi:hypothetical protein FACS189487_00730 [Campylobacterota bacterium]|nr:hypothetical protein FACS189487_00730 [Campylobacterota bacterium]